MKLLVKVRYDGAAYCGFQVQPNGTSVQAVLTRAAEDVFGFPVNVTGCSRTDAGVHALGYVAALEPKDESRRGDAWCTIPAGRVHRAFSHALPPDVAVVGAALAPDTCHPRYGVVSKEYIYRLSDAPADDPFLRGRVCRRPKITPEGEALMRDAAGLFLGTHDFAGFMAAGSKITDTTRTVTAVSLSRDGDGCLVFAVRADGFLYNMVRIMAGTLLDVAAGHKTAADVRRALDTADREAAGFTAPPEGLYLRDVTYPEPIAWQCD